MLIITARTGLISFSMYLNDMAVGIKQLQCGVNLNGFELSILLYADDIVLIAPDERKLQLMLEFVSSWCKKWRMAVNTDKTHVVHFRPARKSRTRTAIVLSEAASRPFGGHQIQAKICERVCVLNIYYHILIMCLSYSWLWCRCLGYQII